MDDASTKIYQLRKWRSRKKRDLGIDSTMLSVCKSLKKTNKQLMQIQEAWNELIPSRLQATTIPTSLRSGVLEITVDGSPTAYQINRLVRSGLLRELQERSGRTLKQIRVRIEH